MRPVPFGALVFKAFIMTTYVLPPTLVRLVDSIYYRYVF